MYLNIGYKSKEWPADSRGGDEMSYRFTVVNTYWAFMKESESEVLKIEESESELLCTDSTALVLTLVATIEMEPGNILVLQSVHVFDGL
jgi:hypothetical protein